MARRRLPQPRPGETLQPTALVHELFLRLGGDHPPAFKNRRHFFGTAARAMNRILVDRARGRLAQKRNGGVPPEPFDPEDAPLAGPPLPDEALDQLAAALEKFRLRQPERAELVELRFFLAKQYDEIAELLGISVPTAKVWWRHARAWLEVEINTSLPD